MRCSVSSRRKQGSSRPAPRCRSKVPVALVDSISPEQSPRRKHVVHVIFAADVSGSLEDVSSQDTAVRGHRAFRLQELDAVPLHPPIQRFLQRWQPGDPAVYLGEMWAP